MCTKLIFLCEIYMIWAKYLDFIKFARPLHTTHTQSCEMDVMNMWIVILVSYYKLKFLIIVWMLYLIFWVKMCFKGFSWFALIEDDQKVKCGVVDKGIIIHILGINSPIFV